jgi:hypothetical protein
VRKDFDFNVILLSIFPPLFSTDREHSSDSCFLSRSNNLIHLYFSDRTSNTVFAALRESFENRLETKTHCDDSSLALRNVRMYRRICSGMRLNARYPEEGMGDEVLSPLRLLLMLLLLLKQ